MKSHSNYVSSQALRPCVKSNMHKTHCCVFSTTELLKSPLKLFLITWLAPPWDLYLF